MSRRKAEHSYPVSAKVEDYSNHVINMLVGIKGRERSDVVAFIIKLWIAEHREELAGYGITVARKDGKLVLGQDENEA